MGHPMENERSASSRRHVLGARLADAGKAMRTAYGRVRYFGSTGISVPASYNGTASRRASTPIPTPARHTFIKARLLVAEKCPLIRSGRFEQDDQVCDATELRAGAKRYCKTYGMGTLDETIHHWEAPRLSVYSVKNAMMPIRDHVAVMATLPENGGTRFHWCHRFNYRGMVMRFAFPGMMLGMMNRGLATLALEFGGEGGRIEACPVD